MGSRTTAFRPKDTQTFIIAHINSYFTGLKDGVSLNTALSHPQASHLRNRAQQLFYFTQFKFFYFQIIICLGILFNVFEF